MVSAGFRQQGEGVARKMGVGMIRQIKKSFSGRDEKRETEKQKKNAPAFTKRASGRGGSSTLKEHHKKRNPDVKKDNPPDAKTSTKRASKKMRHRKSDT
ncbi:MAG: hypothetical protein J6V98_05405 [Bacteroidales bacterium]|nr:hypothetical protein [Bacteroidales bacterium]